MPSYRSSYGAEFGIGGRLTPGIKYLIISNVCVFVIQVLSWRIGEIGIEWIFGLRAVDVYHKFWIWQPVTYMFLHEPSGLFHLLLNMLILWMFGTEMEKLWGTRFFVKYYFVCGVGAGVLTMLLFPGVRTIGASGAIFGVMLAYGITFPNRQILFWFMFPMRAISFVLLIAGVQLFSLLNIRDGIAYSAHLGGMIVGYLYLKRAWRLRRFWNEIRWKLRRRRFRVMREDDDRYPYH